MERESNYKKCTREWKKRFLEMDKDSLRRRIPSLKTEGNNLTMFYFDRKLGICLESGDITVLEDKNAPGGNPGASMLTENDELNIFTYFWYCKETAFFRNQWLPFRDLKDARPFGPAFQKGVNNTLAETFEGHARELEQVLIRMGGKKLSSGDVGYELYPVAEIPMRVLFWEGDEEFPAQANILFDRGSTDYIHVESLVTMASSALYRMVKLSGISAKGSPFPAMGAGFEERSNRLL